MDWTQARAAAMYEIIKRAGRIRSKRDIKRIAKKAEVSEEFVLSLLQAPVAGRHRKRHEASKVRAVLEACWSSEAELNELTRQQTALV